MRRRAGRPNPIEPRLVFIQGRDIYLRPILPDDLGHRYLAWLNDPEVSRYSRRRFWPTRFEEMTSFTKPGESTLHLAICRGAGGEHIGNVSLGPVHWFHRCAEVRILLGERHWWGHGMATQAIYLVTRHAFEVLGLHRVEAGSANPAFNAVVIRKLGWKQEGILRSKFFLEGRFVDIVLTAQLGPDFKRRREFEPAQGNRSRLR